MHNSLFVGFLKPKNALSFLTQAQRSFAPLAIQHKHKSKMKKTSSRKVFDISEFLILRHNEIKIF